MVVKKASTKKTVKKSSTPRVKKQKVQSFQVSRPQSPFFTIAITRQTVYWLIIAMSVLALGTWTLKLQSDVNALYDSIDAAAAEQ